VLPDAIAFPARVRETVRRHTSCMSNCSTSFELLTVTSASSVILLNGNIQNQYSRSVQICPREQFDRISTAVAHGSVRCAFRAESRLTNQVTSRLLYRRRITPGKTQQHRQHIPRRVQSLPGFESQPGAGKKERCGAFAGSPQQCKSQLNF